MTQQVTVEVCGGLGNQLFQYAAGRAAATALQRPLTLDLSYYDETQRPGDFVQFQRECHLSELCTQYIKKKTTTGHVSRLRRISNRLGLKRRSSQCEEINDLDWVSWKDTPPSVDVRLTGYWMSPAFFVGSENELRKELTPRSEKVSQQIRELISIHQRPGRQLIGVHVRRGDVAFAHESNNGPAIGYRLQPLSYYRKAMQLFPKGKFLVFSDDPDWVEAEFQDDRVVSAGHNSEVVDLFALSACDHQIIANSTFSWWAGWLNQNPEKKVVAPQRWYHDGFPRSIDVNTLLPKQWLQIDAS